MLDLLTDLKSGIINVFTVTYSKLHLNKAKSKIKSHQVEINKDSLKLNHKDGKVQ